MHLVTHQTGPAGQMVRRLLIEEGAAIAKEYYLGMVIDRSRQRVALLASSEGGMEIEEVAARSPEKIHKVWIDPTGGLPMRRPMTSRAPSAFPRRRLRRRAPCCRGCIAPSWRRMRCWRKSIPWC